jgi:carbonic anhydrase
MTRFTAAVVMCLFALTSPVAAHESAAVKAAAAAVDAGVQTQASQAAMTPATALDLLKAGNARFVANATARRNWSAGVAATASGQFPFAAVLGCMDSRVPIEIVFDQGIGDVFGLRVAGNIVNDDELGSLEYAVKVGAKLIVVLGHTSCGAVKGALDDAKLGNLTGLLAKIHPAVKAAGCSNAKDDACVTHVAEKNVLQSMKDIRKRSPYLAKYLDEGKVMLVGGMYDVATGRVTFFES